MIATPVWFDDAVQPIATALLTAWPAAGWLDFNRMPWLLLPLDDLAGPTWAEIERHAGASVNERACASRSCGEQGCPQYPHRRAINQQELLGSKRDGDG